MKLQTDDLNTLTYLKLLLFPLMVIVGLTIKLQKSARKPVHYINLKS